MSLARIVLTMGAVLTTAVTTLPSTAANAGPAARSRERAAPLIATPVDLGVGTGTSSVGTHVQGPVVVAEVLGERPNPGLAHARLDEPTPGLHHLSDLPNSPHNATLTWVVDVDLPYIVGSRQAGTASYRGWVHNMTLGDAYDVQGFGGFLAFASAVDGDTVVGVAEVDGAGHAYAADARTGGSVRDLGTLGGNMSQASDVSGGVVVGSARRSDGTTGAFVTRLDDDASLVDLGALGGLDSAARTIDRGIVAGWADVPSGVEHAFATDLDGPPGLVDLGTLGGDQVRPTDLDGSLLVGTATRPDGSEASWWADLGGAGGLHDLGTLPSGQRPPKVSGSFVAGTHETATGRRGFVFDVDGGQTLDLAPLPGHLSTAAADVDGNVVVGTSYASDGTSRAVAWTLSRMGPPAFDFAHERVRADEGARARVTVVRSGDPGPARTVRYRVSEIRGGATAGTDFKPVKGIVRFAAGQTRATFRVPLRQDDSREGPEAVRMRLGNGSAATLVIRASDQRPDARVRLGSRKKWVSNDRARLQVRPGDPADFQVRLGHEPGGGKARVTMDVHSNDPKGVTIRWTLGRRDVTAAVTSKQGLDVAVPAKAKRAPVLYAHVRTPKPLAAGGSKVVKVTTTWHGDVPVSDHVRIRVGRR
jgi:uncharacterized membrane protein